MENICLVDLDECFQYCLNFSEGHRCLDITRRGLCENKGVFYLDCLVFFSGAHENVHEINIFFGEKEELMMKNLNSGSYS